MNITEASDRLLDQGLAAVNGCWPAPTVAAFRGALVLLALSTVAGCSFLPSASPRAVILVTLDTTRADRLGVYGGRAIPTPNLDLFSSEGVVFETAVSPVPMTLPAHASILTGRYPASHGVRHNGIYRLPEEEVTLAEQLRDAGFKTFAVVGAYVLNRGFGTEQGFDVYDDVPVGGFAGGRDHLFEVERPADDVNEHVFRILEKHRRGKMFLWIHYFDPHIPYAPPEKPGRALHGTGYDREISYVDACFGDLMARLARDGWLDRSIVVVVGDHGESLGEHGEETHGLFLYEGTVRVPMFLRAPGLLPRGRRIAGPVGLVDVAPTVLDLLGLPPLQRGEGRSLLPRVAGKEDGAGRLVFGETLMGRLEYGWSELYMVRNARFKYVQAPTAELYDLDLDKGETTNLAGRKPAQAEEMAATLKKWLAEVSKEGGKTDAARALTPEEESRLRSLGYLGGDAFKRADGEAEGRMMRPDPKEMIQEARQLSAARARMARGEIREALAQIESILASNPRNHKARAARIEALCRLGRYRDAEEEAKAGISLAEADPDTPSVVMEESLGSLASAYRADDKTQEAADVYRRILELNASSERAAVALAEILTDQGRSEEALRLSRDVLARNPRSAAGLSARFAAETRLARPQEALATAKALAEVGDGEPGALMEAGDLLTRSREPELATRVYLAARAQMGDDPLLLGKLGTAQLLAGRPGEARDTFQVLARLTPQDPKPWYFLGDIALREGDEREARTQFDRALRQDPSFTPPLVALARWLAKQGREAEAREALLDALRRNPQDEQARRALDAL